MLSTCFRSLVCVVLNGSAPQTSVRKTHDLTHAWCILSTQAGNDGQQMKRWLVKRVKETQTFSLKVAAQTTAKTKVIISFDIWKLGHLNRRKPMMGCPFSAEIFGCSRITLLHQREENNSTIKQLKIHIIAMSSRLHLHLLLVWFYVSS